MTPDLIADRYRVERAVGRGGMGTVWLCRDSVLGRQVAVKQVGRLPGETATDSARAMREARSSAALSHGNVVSVFDVVVDERQDVWLVMEYVPSRSLAQLIAEHGRLAAERVAHIGAQVASGLAAAHAAGVVHRDVKPGNILVTDGDVAKLSDFGIARAQGDTQVTQTGMLTGTAAYFAPELARGAESTPASDVWALGTALFYAVEGRMPYPTADNPLAQLQVILRERPAEPAHAGVLAQPIRRMMDPDPTTRWSMQDAVHALRRAARSGAAPVTPAATAPPAAPPVRPAEASPPRAEAAPSRRTDVRAALPWLVAFAGLALVAVLGILLVTGGDPDEPAAQGEPSAEPSPRGPASQDPTPAPTQKPAKLTPDQQRVQAVRQYFRAMPQDLDAGWARLAPRMQSVGRSNYESFWGSISDVRAGNAVPAGGDAVEVTITYTFEDGRVVRERQLLTMEKVGGQYKIADDQVLSSRTVRG